jgi:hypothetical protein
MEKKGLTGRELRIRGMLLWLPVVVAPLLTILFWIGGGGKGRGATITAAGFLTRLPGARVLPVTRLDKMGYYELARRDSLALRQRLAIQRNYARQLGLEVDSAAPPEAGVMRVKEKLEALKRAVRLPAAGGWAVGDGVRLPVAGARDGTAGDGVRLPVARDGTTGDRMRVPAGSIGPGSVQGLPARGYTSRLPDIARLERVMNVLQRDEGGREDIRELGAVVEKLLAAEQGRGDADGGSPVAIRGPGSKAELPTHDRKVGMTGQGAEPAVQVPLAVRALPEEGDTVGGFDSARIEAVVPEDQVLVSGGEMRLELVRDVQIGRQRVPAGTPLFGTVSLSGERLRVSVMAIACAGRTFPVRLEVEDEDGMAGIFIPGAPVTEALRESAGQELGALGSGLVSTNLAGQAAGAGVVLARSLIGKKIRPVKVTVPAGYQVLLTGKNAGV